MNRRFGGAGIRRRGFRRSASSKSVQESIGDLLTFFRGDGDMTLSTLDVTAWQSSFGSFTLDGGTSPDFVESNSDLNNQPSVNFTAASSEYLTCDALATYFNSSPNISVYAVIDRTSAAANASIWSTGLSSSNNYWTNQISGADTIQVVKKDTGTTSTTGTDTASTQHFVCYTFAGTSVNMYVDGNAANSGTNSRNPTTMTYGTLGALRRNSLSNYFDGSVAEIGFYTKELSAAEVATLQGYSVSRYGTPA